MSHVMLDLRKRFGAKTNLQLVGFLLGGLEIVQTISIRRIEP